jgi:hypothetical protein
MLFKVRASAQGGINNLREYQSAGRFHIFDEPQNITVL